MEDVARALKLANKLFMESTMPLRKTCDVAAGAVGYDTRGTDLIHHLMSHDRPSIMKWAESVDKEKCQVPGAGCQAIKA